MGQAVVIGTDSSGKQIWGNAGDTASYNDIESHGGTAYRPTPTNADLVNQAMRTGGTNSDVYRQLQQSISTPTSSNLQLTNDIRAPDFREYLLQQNMQSIDTSIPATANINLNQNQLQSQIQNYQNQQNLFSGIVGTYNKQLKEYNKNPTEDAFKALQEKQSRIEGYNNYMTDFTTASNQLIASNNLRNQEINTKFDEISKQRAQLADKYFTTKTYVDSESGTPTLKATNEIKRPWYEPKFVANLIQGNQYKKASEKIDVQERQLYEKYFPVQLQSPLKNIPLDNVDLTPKTAQITQLTSDIKSGKVKINSNNIDYLESLYGSANLMRNEQQYGMTQTLTPEVRQAHEATLAFTNELSKYGTKEYLKDTAIFVGTAFLTAGVGEALPWIAKGAKFIPVVKNVIPGITKAATVSAPFLEGAFYGVQGARTGLAGLDIASGKVSGGIIKLNAIGAETLGFSSGINILSRTGGKPVENTVRDIRWNYLGGKESSFAKDKTFNWWTEREVFTFEPKYDLYAKPTNEMVTSSVGKEYRGFYEQKIEYKMPIEKQLLQEGQVISGRGKVQTQIYLNKQYNPVDPKTQAELQNAIRNKPDIKPIESAALEPSQSRLSNFGLETPVSEQQRELLKIIARQEGKQLQIGDFTLEQSPLQWNYDNSNLFNVRATSDSSGGLKINFIRKRFDIVPTSEPYPGEASDYYTILKKSSGTIKESPIIKEPEIKPENIGNGISQNKNQFLNLETEKVTKESKTYLEKPLKEAKQSSIQEDLQSYRQNKEAIRKATKQSADIASGYASYTGEKVSMYGFYNDITSNWKQSTSLRQPSSSIKSQTLVGVGEEVLVPPIFGSSRTFLEPPLKESRPPEYERRLKEPKQDSIMIPMVSTAMISGVKQATDLSLVYDQSLLYDQTQINTPNPPRPQMPESPTPPRPKVPEPPTFPIPMPGLKLDMENMYSHERPKRVKKKTKYTPSFDAYVLGIVGKQPKQKIFTGQETRPLHYDLVTKGVKW